MREAWLVLGTLAVLVAVNVPSLGSDPWLFRPGRVHPTGIFAPLVRAGHDRWDLGLLRTAATLAGVLVTALALVLLRSRRLRTWVAIASVAVVCVLLLAPGIALQAGLRQSTRPWFYTNDSTYQIELAGSLVRHGSNPYGHDYGHSGLERFYSLDGSREHASPQRRVALRHFAYFPGTALAAAAWGLLPAPLDDYRFLVALSALLLLPASLLFPGPLALRLAVGAALVANPLTVRAAWFGTADAPSVLFVVLAFGFALRSRFAWSAGSIAVAILLKQFALGALPFLAVLVAQRAARSQLPRALAVFAAVVLAGFVPFIAAGPADFWADTVRYGAGTYRIIGYGLSALLLRAHVLSSRTGYYPFWILTVAVWLPLTVWLLRLQWRSRAAWIAGTAFAVSIFTLLFLGRVFQTSYLIWPLSGGLLAVLAAGADLEARSHPATSRIARAE